MVQSAASKAHPLREFRWKVKRFAKARRMAGKDKMFYAVVPVVSAL